MHLLKTYIVEICQLLFNVPNYGVFLGSCSSSSIVDMYYICVYIYIFLQFLILAYFLPDVIKLCAFPFLTSMI